MAKSMMGGPCAGRGIARGPDMAVSQSRGQFSRKTFHIDDHQLSYTLGWTLDRKGMVGKERKDCVLSNVFSLLQKAIDCGRRPFLL